MVLCWFTPDRLQPPLCIDPQMNPWFPVDSPTDFHCGSAYRSRALNSTFLQRSQYMSLSKGHSTWAYPKVTVHELILLCTKGNSKLQVRHLKGLKSTRLWCFKLLFPSYNLCLNTTNDQKKAIPRYGRQIDITGWLFEGTSTILIGGDMSATPFLKRPNNLLAHFEDAPSFKQCSGPKTICIIEEIPIKRHRS